MSVTESLATKPAATFGLSWDLLSDQFLSKKSELFELFDLKNYLIPLPTETDFYFLSEFAVLFIFSQSADLLPKLGTGVASESIS